MTGDVSPLLTWMTGCIGLALLTGISAIVVVFGIIETIVAIVGTLIFVTVVPYVIGAILVTVGKELW